MAYEQKVWRHHGIGVLASSEILSYGVIFKKSRVALTSATFCRFWRGTGLHFVFPFQGNRQSQKAKRKKRRLRVSLMVAKRSNTKWFLFLCHSKWVVTGDGPCRLLKKEQMALSKPYSTLLLFHSPRSNCNHTANVKLWLFWFLVVCHCQLYSRARYI